MRFILSYVYAFNGLLALITIVEVLFNFKRPILLKIILIISLLIFLLKSGGEMFIEPLGYNRWYRESLNPILFVCLLCFSSFLYQFKVAKYILIYTSTLIALNFLGLLFFTFIIPVNNNLRIIDIPQFRMYIIIPKLIFFLIGIYFSIITISGVLKRKVDNIYSKKLKKWSFLLTLNVVLIVFSSNLLVLTYPNGLVFRICINVLIFVQILLFLFRPIFLNKTNLKISLLTLFETKDNSNFFLDKFSTFFFLNTYYLNNNANSEELAQLMGISTVELNKLTITHHSLTFIDLVNKSRVDYFVDLIKLNDFSVFTIEALAHKSGFGSRQNLYKSFKKFHGGTPSDLIRSIQEIS